METRLGSSARSAALFLTATLACAVLCRSALVAEEPGNPTVKTDSAAGLNRLLNDRPSLITPVALPVVDANPSSAAMAAELMEIRRRLQTDSILGSEFDGFDAAEVTGGNDERAIREQLLHLGDAQDGFSATDDEDGQFQFDSASASNDPRQVAGRAVKRLQRTAAELAAAGFAKESDELRVIADRLATQGQPTSKVEKTAGKAAAPVETELR